MTIWQIAAGETGRDYSSLCIEHDIVLIGPGSLGPYNDGSYPGPGCDRVNAEQIRLFYEGPRPGDLVLLRLGHCVKAVGVIPEGDAEQYQWREEFDDVLGWDLQHTRRVIWDKNALPHLDDLQPVFKSFKQQRTITRVHKHGIPERAKELRSAVRIRVLRDLPEIGKILTDDELGIELFASGLANEAVEDVISSIRKIRRLASWYRSGDCGKRPNEHEIVAHAVVPLMLGLGWSEQLLGVEWNRIDVAFFSRPPTVPKNCIAICEAKKLASPLGRACDQAKGYVEKLKLSRCKVIITTDGTSLFVYRREGKDWPGHPTGYANFAKMRTVHAIPENTSAVDTLVNLMPARIHQDEF